MKIETPLTHLRSSLTVPDADSAANQPDDTIIRLPPTPRSRLLEPFRDSAFSLGLVMLIVSAGAFGLYDLLGSQRQNDGNTVMIMLHYGLAVVFSLVLLINGHWRTARYPERRPARWLGLLLWLVSAYALNREMAVFQESTAWLRWALVIVGTAMVGYGWKETLPVRWQQFLYAVLAFGWWLFAYMAVYIVQLYPISTLLLIALGLSAHTFVPLVLAIVLGKRLWQDARLEEHLRPGVSVGLAVPIVALIVFLTGWVSDVNRIEQTRMNATIRHTSDLPDWVLVAQQLTPGWITNRLLLANRIYDRGRFFDNNDWGLGGLTSFDDVRQHDPLVLIAGRLFPAGALADADNLNVIKVLNGERHNAEEKFWTGRHLTTEDVVSQVRIWPQFRLSYTEKTIRIRNQARSTTEEALFTFHLPPGSVVSSMSLWVNGVEESARLTTIAKADSAYRTIVNVESKVVARDPSVVHWQEGNRVTVRVFPCQAGTDRQVKLGITSPLRLDGSELVYENPYFDGPDAGSADELVSVDFSAAPDGLQSPWSFDKLTGNNLTHRGRYSPDWTLRFRAPALAKASFMLDGRAYQMEAYRPTTERFMPTDVYLDVNKAWKKYEFTTAYWTAKHAYKSRVWVFDDGLKQLDSATLSATFDRLVQQRFSLFPIYRITDPAKALLITKGTPSSPTLSDLRNSVFADRMQQTGTRQSSIRTFCYGDQLSPYLKTLAELRVLTVTHGTTCDLIYNVAKKHQFPRQPNEADRIVLAQAGVSIRVTPLSDRANQPANAPDHLARLFTYNHLLQSIGRHYFTPNYQTNKLIQEAQQAHIVSPLSSLIVLETAEDYDRFGIKKDASGLDNATLKEQGAVPEPHEWALLIMVAGLIGWLLWQKRRGSGPLPIL